MATSSRNQAFAGRREAGESLAAELAARGFIDPVVVAMPRGGVPVAAVVAAHLGASFDIAVVRKLGAPRQPELAIGAIAEDGAIVIDRATSESLRLDPDDVQRVRQREQRELVRRVELYRTQCPRIDLDGRNVILIDDGLATGCTAAAAAQSLRRRGAARIVLAVPVCPAESADSPPDPAINELICLVAPEQMQAVGYWYEHFPQVTDAEVLAELRLHCARDRD